MAHHKATLKSIRQTAVRTERNTARRSRVRTFIKRVDTAIAENKAKDAAEALKAAQKELFKAVTKGVIKKETASRKISRLNAKVKAIAKKK